MDIDATIGDLITLSDVLSDGTQTGQLTEGTLNELGTRYATLLHSTALIKEMLSHLEVALIEAMPEDTLEMGDVTVQRKKRSRFAWKDKDSGARMREDLAHAVATKLSTDVATGEVDPMRRNLINAGITELFTVIPAVQDMKQAGAKNLGLSIFDYKTRDEVNTITVTITEEPE